MTTSTLILRLEGPTQAWGAPGAAWETRPTMTRPTKSGVLGLVANALGRDHTDPASDLAELTFAVRADRPGHELSDYQSVGGGRFPLDALTILHNPRLAERPDLYAYGAPRDPDTTTDGARVGTWGGKSRDTLIKRSSLLIDAAFLVGLHGNTDLLDQIAQAVTRPARLLTLGRRNSPPAQPLMHHLLHETSPHDWVNTLPLLDTATTTEPFAWIETRPGDSDAHNAAPCYEQPTGYREYAPTLIRQSITSPTPHTRQETR